MACVRKRRGRFVVDFRDASGKRHWQSYRTKGEANDALAELHKQLRERTYRDPSSLPTFAEVADAWFALQQDHPPSTIDYWRNQLERHFKPAFGALRIDQVTKSEVEAFRTAKFAGTSGHEKLGRQTTNQMLQTITVILEYAAEHGYITSNPAKSVKRIRMERRAGTAGIHAITPKEVMTAEQAGLFIECARPGLYGTYIAASLHTGARSGELLALSWAHVDLKAATLRIERSLSWERKTGDAYGSSRPVFGPPKTDSGYRTIDLAPDLVEALTTWKLQSQHCQDDDLVFCNTLGKPMHRAILYKGLAEARKTANETAAARGVPALPHVGLHGLRHTFASIMIMLGKPVSQVSKILGHKNPELTLKVYTHWFSGVSSASAMADLAAAIRPPAARSGSNVVALTAERRTAAA